MPNLEFYPNDFPTAVSVTPEQLIGGFKQEIQQTLFQQLNGRREALKAQIGSKNSMLVVGERMPSPSVSPNMAELENAREYATLQQHREMLENMVDLMRQIQQWQASTLEKPASDSGCSTKES